MINSNISGVDFCADSLKSPNIMKAFIKVLTKVEHMDVSSRGIFILFSHDFVSLSFRGSKAVKASLGDAGIKVGSGWRREDLGIGVPAYIARVARRHDTAILSVPINHPILGILGYIGYVSDVLQNVEQAEPMLIVFADYLYATEFNRQRELNDDVNQCLIKYQQTRFLVLDADGFMVYASGAFYEYFNTTMADMINYHLFDFFIFPPNIKTQIQHTSQIINENVDFDFSGELQRLNLTFDILNSEFRVIIFAAVKQTAGRMQGEQAGNRLQPMLATLKTQSPKMQRVINSAKEAVKNTSPIYILGEEGTGKRSLALMIHNSCEKFKDGPFIAVNLHSVAKSEMSDLLLGTEESGGGQSKFTQATGGTLYIERIDLLPGVLQAALTHIILTKTLFDINKNTAIDLNFRLITSSIKPLDELVHQRRFCPSLYFYLTGATLSLPGLNDRKEDIPYLIDKKLRSLDVSSDGVDLALAGSFHEYALNRTWAGNLAELFKWVEHAYLNKDDVMTASNDIDVAALASPIHTLEELETREIANALSILSRKYIEVAEQLGISQSTLRRKIAKYNL